MPLVLTLHRARDQADRQRESRTLAEGSLSIGRGTNNGWVLQDPAQHLSKTHCIVTAVRGGFTLTDCSSNGVFLNGSTQRMPRDSQAPIGDGDEFVLGDYLVQARLIADLSDRAIAAVAGTAPKGSPPAIQRDDPFGLDEFLSPRPAAAPPPPPAFDPFADPASARRVDPFGDDDILGNAPAPHRPFNEPGRAAAPPPATPDPFDVRATRGDDAFGADDDLFRGATPAVQWQGPSQPDDADGVHQSFLSPKAITPATSPDEWDDLLGDTPPGTPPASPAAVAPPPPPAAVPVAAAPVATVPVAAEPTAPAPTAPAPIAPPPSAPPSPPPGQADAAKLIAAFLDGAGVPTLDVSKQDPEQYMHAAGALFGLMVESLRDVLMSRAAVKGEFGIEQTMLRPRENNALKFSVTPADAVSALLQPGRPGYMDPLRATREAFDDVRVHQLAVMAGVQAALFNLLRTFDPATLESRLQKAGMIESFLPATRRAKLWEAFVSTYKDIARDADSDFQDVFGREFSRAYTQQAKNE